MWKKKIPNNTANMYVRNINIEYTKIRQLNMPNYSLRRYMGIKIKSQQMPTLCTSRARVNFNVHPVVY